MVTIQNQTDPAELTNIDPNTRGTGIFAVPDPTKPDFGAITKLPPVHDLTYDECIMRGFFCVAFKWIANKPGRLVPNSTQCPDAGLPCVTTCRSDLCLCIKGRCQ